MPRTALALAAVGAVAATVVTTAVLTGSDRPAPATSASSAAADHAGRTSIPDDGSIPAGFPLASGWPTEAEPGPRYGLTGPDPSLPPLEFSYCDGGYTATGGRDVLRADWDNIEDYRRRALLAFADEPAAAAFLADFADSWTACPRSPSGAGYTAIHDTEPTDLGDESTALVGWTEYDGAQAVGLQVVHVVRVGAAILIDSSANECNRTGVDSQVAGQGAEAASVVDAMCDLSGSGC